MARAPRTRRGFGRVQPRANGRYRVAYTGSGCGARPGTRDLREQGRRHRLAVQASRRDRHGGLGPGRRGPWRRELVGADLPGVRRPWLETRWTKRVNSADDPAAVPDAARHLHLSAVRRDADPTGSQRRRQRRYHALAPGRETHLGPSHTARRELIFASAASEQPTSTPADPYNPAHITRGRHTSGASLQPATLRRSPGDRRDLARPRKLDGAARRLCAMRFGESCRAPPPRRRPVHLPAQHPAGRRAVRRRASSSRHRTARCRRPATSCSRRLFCRSAEDHFPTETCDWDATPCCSPR